MSTEKITPVNAELSDEQLLHDMRTFKKWSLAGKILLVAAFPLAFALLGIFGVYEMIEIRFASAAGELVLALVIGFYANKRSVKLKETLGRALMLPVIKEIFDVKDFQPNGHLPSGLINSAGLVDDWNRIEGSDYIEGSYRGVNILYSDLHLQRREEERDSDGKKTVSYTTVFRGQWMICDFGKELAASIRLIERMGGSMWQRAIDARKSDIETENVEFNKKYRILTEDGHTAFYLLTPHFMEKLVATDEAANASTRFCFQDGKVHIALYIGRDSFELKGVKLADMESVRQKFRGDMKYMTDIMNEQLLNDRLFREN